MGVYLDLNSEADDELSNDCTMAAMNGSSPAGCFLGIAATLAGATGGAARFLGAGAKISEFTYANIDGTTGVGGFLVGVTGNTYSWGSYSNGE